MRNILLTGGSGFLGWNISLPLQELGYAVIGTSSTPRTYSQKPERPQFAYLDLASEHSFVTVLEQIKPDVIIHAAAISSPLYAEQNPDETYLVNVNGTALLLHYAEKYAIPVVFISTDLVFSGSKGDYTEADKPDATIIYGTSKLRAEQLFLDSTYNDWLILRCSLMYGHLPSWIERFPQQAVEKARKGEQVVLFTDQFRTPIFAPDIAHYLHQVFRQNIWGEIFHCGGPEKLSRSEMVLQYFYSCGIQPTSVIRCSMDEVPSYSTTVRDVSLDSSKLHRLIDFEPTSLETAYRTLAGLQQKQWIV